jgi:hypothetical protein
MDTLTILKTVFSFKVELRGQYIDKLSYIFVGKSREKYICVGNNPFCFWSYSGGYIRITIGVPPQGRGHGTLAITHIARAW